ncbi:hypothetical protein A3Q56_01819 [Intoshia linei]|uniref:Globin domain-containing protein n=1 Tax=Intoshia linei TaxID=1819745 RepID=A0A177BA77_9BILA|nr:hypothetical protein A3Q56_01819 [Intoshia linei]
MIILENLNDEVVLKIIKTWDQLNNKETAMRFYHHLFTIYPETLDTFKKFKEMKLIHLNKDKHALIMAKVLWSSMAHIIECLKIGDQVSMYKCINYLIEKHVKVKYFHPSMFQLAIKPFLATVEEKNLTYDEVDAYMELDTWFFNLEKKKLFGFVTIKVDISQTNIYLIWSNGKN